MNFLTNDTLTLKDVDEKGRYWKEKKINDIIVGFLNVPAIQKDEFEKSISTIKKK